MSVRISRVVAGAAVIVGLMVSGDAATSDVTLSVSGRASANVSLAASGTFVAAVWSASAPDGETDIYAAASRDGGRSFSSPVRVNSIPGDARVNGEQPPRLALKDRSALPPEIAVVWTTKGTAGSKLLSAASIDGGRTFQKSALVPGNPREAVAVWNLTVTSSIERQTNLHPAAAR